MSSLSSLGRGIKWGSINAVSMIACKILRGVLIPKLLDPASYGLFVSLGIFSRYLQFADFGASAWFSKEMPRYHFNEDVLERQALINTAFTLVVLSFGSVCIYLGSAAVMYKGEAADFYVLSLLLLIPITILSKTREFLVNYSIAIQEYGKGTRGNIAYNYVSLVLVVLGIWCFGALGGVAAMLISEIIVVSLMFLEISMPVSLVWSTSIFKKWRQIGKQFMVSITDVMASTVDQIIILRSLDASSLGLYALGLTFAWVMEAVSEIFNTASYPKLMATAKSERARAVELLDQTIFCFLLSAIVVLPLALIAIEVLVNYYFTSYKLGLSVYSLMLLLGLFRGMTSLLRRGYIAFDMEKTYVKYTAATTLIYALAIQALMISSIRFDNLVVAIILLNLIGALILYIIVARKISASAMRNVSLVAIISTILGFYQYFVNVTESTPAVPARLALAGLILVCAAGYVYSKRTVFYDYIR